MQTIRRAAAILLAVLFLLASCGKPQDGPVDTIKIGVSVYRQDDTFISLLVDHLNEYAKTYEQIKGVKLQLDFSYAQYNQSLQNDQIDGFLQKDYDVVLVNVVDRTAAGGLVDKAKTAQKPIIFFNREPVREDLDRWRLAYYVGADAAESGELEGRLLVDAYMDDPARLDRNGDGVLQYVMLEGDPGHQDSMIRTETSVRTLTQAGIRTEKLASSIANWQRVQASTKMLLWIEKFGRLKPSLRTMTIWRLARWTPTPIPALPTCRPLSASTVRRAACKRSRTAACWVPFTMTAARRRATSSSSLASWRPVKAWKACPSRTASIC